MGLGRVGRRPECCLNRGLRGLRRWVVMDSRPRRASAGVGGGFETCLYCASFRVAKGTLLPLILRENGKMFVGDRLVDRGWSFDGLEFTGVAI